MEMICPVQLFYSDGVERLGAELARERVRRASAIWYVSLASAILPTHDVFREGFDRSVTVPNQSEAQSPTGSMRTIRSMAGASTNSSSTVSRSRSTTFLPTMDTIPGIPGFQSLSGLASGPCLGNRRCTPTLLMMARSPIKPSSIRRHTGDCS